MRERVPFQVSGFGVAGLHQRILKGVPYAFGVAVCRHA
jgi:hypothetical protein